MQNGRRKRKNQSSFNTICSSWLQTNYYKQEVSKKQADRASYTKKKPTTLFLMTSYTDINFHLLWYFSNSNAITFCNFTNRNIRLHISPHRLYLKSQPLTSAVWGQIKFFTAIQIHKSWALYNCQWVLNTEIRKKIMFCYRNEVKRQKVRTICYYFTWFSGGMGLNSRFRWEEIWA